MQELDVRDKQKLMSSFELADSFVKKNYLSKLTQYNIVQVPEDIKGINIRESIRLFKINKVVYDKKENNLDKLSSVYNALKNINSSLIMIIENEGLQTNIYIGTRVFQKTTNINGAKSTLEKSFKGHFPGSDIENLTNGEIEKLLSGIMKSELSGNEKTVSAVSGIPALKNEDKEKFVQGIEKLIDSMSGEKFSAIFIGDPIEQNQIEDIKLGYESLYSQLAPFASTELNFSQNESQSIAESITTGFTETLNESLTKTQSHTDGSSCSKSHTSGDSTSRSLGGVVGTIAAGVGFLAAGPLGLAVAGGAGGALASLIGSNSKSESDSNSFSKNSSETSGFSDTVGTSYANSSQEGKTDTSTIGNSRSLNIKFENKSVTNLLSNIDEQITRIKASEDFGLWNCAGYFISDNIQTARVAASTFKAIMRGQNSSIENSFINTWDNINNKSNLIELKKYLEKFCHPLIDMNVDNGLNVPYVTPGSLVSGQEISIQFGLPLKSVNGLPVLETAEFGRNVITYDKNVKSSNINLGKIFHMGQIEDTNVDIDTKSLTMHTFITGSTGSGKSNTIYKLLHELEKKKIKFLVIEPAKGEYKTIFGGKKGVEVFGTNPQYTSLLKINPFKFPNNIHVLEHIDRLIEIFNACWPMYAAMPAVLKEAVERAYEKSGWDLENSINIEDDSIYPSFEVLLNTLAEVIQMSGYSEELKSDYTGALVTRVKSLTNGLVGRIFTEDEVENSLLFDENCIIDISRIGSSETKSLIMGIVFMRLQEHRFSSEECVNSSLKHVTVLEEAHNLLRKTSTEQSQEGTNLQGKSVEMIANAIAEMRTYGEGFIIADQAPGLLDASVIRNTNTKIILRLPDECDRELVGKAANLNEDQIIELAKLRTGVAAVYQNNWLQPVLCSVEEYTDKEPLIYTEKLISSFNEAKKYRSDLLKLLLQGRTNDNIDLATIDIDGVNRWLTSASLSYRYKKRLQDNIYEYQLNKCMELWKQDNFEELSEIVSGIIDNNILMYTASKSKDISDWNYKYKKGMRKYIDLNENTILENSLIQCLLQHAGRKEEELKNFYFAWVEHIRKGSVS